MKCGKKLIHDLPINYVTELGIYAQQLESEARARGELLPPAIRLQIGEPTFLTPEHIRRAAAEMIEHEQLTYGPAAGWPWLRELLAQKIARVNGYSIKPEQTAVAIGGTGAILASLMATVGEGDEVLIPDPHWPHYTMQLACCGAREVAYALDPNNEWLPDVTQLEQLVTPRTKLLILNTPHNPTGSVLPPHLIQELLAFARRHDLYLLSDECYDQIIFDGMHVSPAAFLSPEELESGRCMCVYSFSKTYSMTGWRLGYVASSTQLIRTITNILNATNTNVSTAVQKAGAVALTGSQECVAQMCEGYRRRRDIAIEVLRDFGRYAYTPHGAFYLLIAVGDKLNQAYGVHQLVFDLLQKRNVAVAPGNVFGAVSRTCVRISLGASEHDIERGVREICEFAKRGTDSIV
jgi:aspartate aminotransferase/aminotransferase